MSSQKRGLEQFVRQQLFRERQIPLEKFVLRHAKVGSRGIEVDEFPISGQLNSDHVPVMVEDILSRAQMYADGLGTKLQGFSLEAIVEGAKTGPRFAFKVRGEGEEEEDGDGENEPTEKGMTAQLMRHNEALMRMLVMTTGSSVQHLQRQLEASGKTIQELVASQNEQRKLIEVANSEQHERDMQMLLTSGQEDRKGALFKQIEQLIPVVIRKVSGQPLLTTSEQSLLTPFFASMSEEQLKAIAAQLTPQQQIALFQVYNEIKKQAASQKQEPNGVS